MIIEIFVALGIIFIFRVIVTVMSKEKRHNTKSFSDITKLHYWEDMRMALFTGATIAVSIVCIYMVI